MEFLENIETLDLTVNQLSKKYNVEEKEIENTLKKFEERGFIEIDYCDEDIGNSQVIEVMMSLDITDKGKKLLKKAKQ